MSAQVVEVRWPVVADVPGREWRVRDERRTLRRVAIVGPVTGRTYGGLDTGERWNGAPVVAFSTQTLIELVEAGDGRDANGEGLRTAGRSGRRFVDVVDGSPRHVRSVVVSIKNATTVLHVPAGRTWDVLGSVAA